MKPTPSQTVGPFFAVALCREEMVEGGPVRIQGTVFDGAGEPVPDAYIELWDGARLGRCPTDEEGRFAFATVEPEHGHVNVSVFARGLLQRLVTRIYFREPDDPTLGALLAREAGDGSYRFDIHLQGDRETVFFAL
ncbi:MAG: protocatechuate 3,4-dioxygenase, alpha subunit [Thermoleophilaceae bacterium]|jgi:protocatechuate 3,4-dioxygenase alpha subunit|nr:protocatechuate 3,4-dioxygenase, alpha subunit [Thermoleophilaceae bacterium]